ncbi:hypothetical protein V1638_12755 [Pseudarthrobacter sp. J64]|uniref:hypothetical protein n=1 Tax=Pseudarthrobacter sp. J64 TaxID=3116485 RepID=UPI002E80314C|nr:hypothetical protein [Pseudarthrobacter sp. J64]MEE2570259.1 hypothetical protein [Pseudarthrobacter sp. J64]
MVRQGKPATSRPAPKRTVSPAVYRRRRLFVGVALLVVLAVVLGGLAAAGVFRGSTEQASSTQSTPPSGGETAVAGDPTSAPTAEPTPTAPATPTCDQNLVTVAAATDKTLYLADEKPMLTLQVTNGGTVACEVNMGTSQMEFLVTSGTDRIFSSKDCQAKSEDLVKVIQPGQSESANFPWQRNRSVEGCQPVAAVPGAGGAYYVYTAKLGKRTSQKAVFQLQ